MIVRVQSKPDNFPLILDESRFLLRHLKQMHNKGIEGFQHRIEFVLVKGNTYHKIIKQFRNKQTLELASLTKLHGYIDNKGNLYNDRKMIRGNIHLPERGINCLSHDGYLL